VEENAFQDAVMLTSAFLPNSLQHLGSQAFYNCARLERVVLPNNLQTLERGVFQYCSKLVQATIPESVTMIRSDAFFGCSSLTQVTIPSRVDAMEGGVFGLCSKLASIHVLSFMPVDLSATIDYDVFLGLDKSSCNLFVPIGASSLYATSPVWKDFKKLTEESVAVHSRSMEPIQVSPNPVRSEFRLNGSMESYPYELTDLNGKCLLKGKLVGTTPVSVAKLPDGLYLLHIQAPNGTFVCKLVKKNR
jgi:hypothetical protein